MAPTWAGPGLLKETPSLLFRRKLFFSALCDLPSKKMGEFLATFEAVELMSFLNDGKKASHFFGSVLRFETFIWSKGMS